MYEKLIKNLRENVKDGCSDCTETAPLILQAADAIEDLDNRLNLHRQGKIRHWIPVTERLPEEEEVVLVWGGASVYTAKRHNKYGGLMWWKLNSKQHYCNPTHWMPLPEPPESEGE